MAPLEGITSAKVHKVIGILFALMALVLAGTSFSDGEIVRGALWVVLGIGTAVVFWRFARAEEYGAE